MSPPVPALSAKRLDALYGEVDRVADALHAEHGAALQCRKGCAACCTDGVTVFEVEALRIQERNHDLISTEPAAQSGCAFLGEDKRCRIYADRPYVCRTQGLPLRWIDVEGEFRDICPLNDEKQEGRPGLSVLSVAPTSCFELGPFEGQLAQIQADHQAEPGKPGGPLARIALRDLFPSPIRGRV